MSYANVISLGFFCSVAKELEEIGLRNSSAPFDWCVSNFEGVLKAIDSGFEDFLLFENLEQSSKLHHVYRDNKYDIEFFHDFNAKEPLKVQYKKVCRKYKRRIARFMEDIKEPTLFVRYIETQNELSYIERHFEEICRILKKHNPNNDIIFIGNNNLNAQYLEIYAVEKDEGDAVARTPLKKNDELYALLAEMEFGKREKNLERLALKKKKTIRNILMGKVRVLEKNRLSKKIDYIHQKQFFRY